MTHYVYRFIGNGKILYTGETNDMKRRMEEHFLRNGGTCSECIEQTNRIEYLVFDSSVMAKMFELYYMNIEKPEYNKRDKTDEVISTISEFQKVLSMWDLYVENVSVQDIIRQMEQEAKEEKQRLIDEFDECNTRLAELTLELKLTHRRMKQIIDAFNEDAGVRKFLGENFIYGCPYNQAKYITEEAENEIRSLVEKELVNWYLSF